MGPPLYKNKLSDMFFILYKNISSKIKKVNENSKKFFLKYINSIGKNI